VRRRCDRWVLSVALLSLACHAVPDVATTPRSIDPTTSVARLASAVEALEHPYRWYGDLVAPLVDERLRTLPGAFDEIVVIMRVDGESAHGDRLELYVAHDRAEVRYHPFGRSPGFFRRAPSPAELASLSVRVRALQSPPESSTDDGTMLVCCHVTPGGVKVVSAQEPDQERGGGAWLELEEWWNESLERAGWWTWQPIPVPRIEGLRVEFAAPDGYVGAVWAEGDDVRVRVHARAAGSWSPGRDLTAQGWSGTRPRWVALKNGALGEPTAAPERYAIAAALAYDAGEEAWQTQRMHGDIHGEVVAVETGGRRCVVRRGKRLYVYEDADESFRELEDQPTDATGYRFLHDLGGGQLLLARPLAKFPPWQGPCSPTLDVLCVFLDEAGCLDDRLESPHPFFQPVAGGFQVAGERSDLVWATWVDVWDRAAQWTVIGRYDVSSLDFVERSEELVGLRCITDSIWVDEPAGRVYALQDGALFSFPLPELSKPR
jgi:hypothetical protein